jgi:hypothetical protein
MFLLALTDDADFGENYMTQYVLRRIFFVVPQYRHVSIDVYLWWHCLVQTICISMMPIQTSVTDQTRKWFLNEGFGGIVTGGFRPPNPLADCIDVHQTRSSWGTCYLQRNGLRISPQGIIRRNHKNGCYQKVTTNNYLDACIQDSSRNIIRMIKSRTIRAGHVTRIGEKRNAYRILVGNPERKRPLERSRCRWMDYIKIDLREVGWYGLDRSGCGRDQWSALVNVAIEHSGSIKCWEVIK